MITFSQFQSTHPLRDATIGNIGDTITIHIFQSTHPLRDATYRLASSIHTLYYFNPRTPYGMRRQPQQGQKAQFNISIHAPLTGCDAYHIRVLNHLSYFNPRTPYGMRHVQTVLNGMMYVNFNPRTPYGMRRKDNGVVVRYAKFQSTHPLRDATHLLHRHY